MSERIKRKRERKKAQIFENSTLRKSTNSVVFFFFLPFFPSTENYFCTQTDFPYHLRKIFQDKLPLETIATIKKVSIETIRVEVFAEADKCPLTNFLCLETTS